MRALIVEDDPRYGAHLERLLAGAGFLAELEPDAERALEKGFDPGLAVVILDLMLRAGQGGAERAVDGFSLLRRWRKKGVATPVLVLTASRTDLEDTTLSYELDADYEIKRPGEEFDALLLAWARSRAARAAAGAGAAGGARARRFGALKVDLELREVRLGDRRVELSNIEYNMLIYLAKDPGVWRSVDEIALAAFDGRGESASAQVYEYVKRLRQKLGFGAIVNQRGRGYRFGLGEETSSDAEPGAGPGSGSSSGPGATGAPSR